MAEQTSAEGEKMKDCDFYKSWLLRIWQEHSDAPFRIQLKSVSTGAKTLFEELPELFDFLADEIDSNQS